MTATLSCLWYTGSLDQNYYRCYKIKLWSFQDLVIHIANSLYVNYSWTSIQMAATLQQHHLILALILPLKLSGQRLTWETQPVCLVHVLSLQAHWLAECIATVVVHSHKEHTGRLLTPVNVKPWTKSELDVCVRLLCYLQRYGHTLIHESLSI